MRDDLTKVLCEAERSRSWDHYSNYRNLKKFEDKAVLVEGDIDDRVVCCRYMTAGGSSTRESMKFRYRYGWKKSFGEHLSPLYGLIRKNIGRKFDTFFSELKKNFDTRSATGNHIFLHLYDQLAKPENTYIGGDGKVWYRGNHRGDRPIHEVYYEYFVDPRDGILKVNRHKRTYRQQRAHDAKVAQLEREKTLRVVNDTTELHLIDGVWFEVKFQAFDGRKVNNKVTSTHDKTTYYRESIEYPLVYDVVKKTTVQANRVAVSKRTISHKDLKKYGLIV